VRQAMAEDPPTTGGCLFVVVYDVDGARIDLIRGSRYFINMQLVPAEVPAEGGDESCPLGAPLIADRGELSGFKLELERQTEGALADVDWSSVISDSSPDVLTTLPDAIEPFLFDWSRSEDGLIFSTTAVVEEFPLTYEDGGQTFETVIGAFSIFMLDVSADAVLGTYRLVTTAIGGSVDLANVAYEFTIVAAPAAKAPRPTRLSCDVEPTVGATVTCTVRADPNIEILWSASTNPVFADGVVTTDDAGIGTFSFVVPAGALGQQVLVEVVGWLEPLAIGTAGGPVPRAIPAGDAPDSRVALLLLLGGLAVVAPRALREARFTVNH
jgi:hypothetical protein